MTQQSKIRLLIADDHDVVRSGLKGMLAGTDIKVVGEVTSGCAAVEYVLKNEVDVVLLDVRMPDGDGLNTLGRIRLDKPSLPILMFSYVDNPPYVARAVAFGANGYLLKDCTRDELVGASRPPRRARTSGPARGFAASRGLWQRHDSRPTWKPL